MARERIAFEYPFPASLADADRAAAAKLLDEHVEKLDPTGAVRAGWAALDVLPKQNVPPGDMAQQVAKLDGTVTIRSRRGFRYVRTPLGVVCVECSDLLRNGAPVQVMVAGVPIPLLVGYKVLL